MSDNTSQNLMPKNVWNGVKLIGSVVVATLFVQNELKETLKSTIEPLMNRVEKLETTTITLQQTAAIQTYKIQVIEQTAKEFVKPNEIEFKTRKK